MRRNRIPTEILYFYELLTPPPRRSVFAVFDGHAHGFQLVAEFVRTRPLFLFARLRAFGDERNNLCFVLA